jgi:hypothetical protein
MLVSLSAFAAFSVWWKDPTIRSLGYVALVALPFLMRSLVVLGRREASAGTEQPRGSEAVKRTNRGTKTVGIGMALLGLALFVVGLLNRQWAVVGLSLLVAMAGVLLVRVSLDHVGAAGSGGDAIPERIGRFDRLMRTTGVILVPLAAFSLGSLYLDAAHGYREGWPLYAFFVVALASALVWPYLFARAYGRWLRR